VTTLLAHVTGWASPWWTVLVNLTGSFALAFLVALDGARAPSHELRLFLGAGILGGYTTYSTFNAETLALLEGGRVVAAAVNVGVTVVGALAAGALGIALARALG
jgi:CrcB protein